jgi:uridine phosphorylase
MNYPILEFDPARDAIIEPHDYLERRDDMPERAVLCFFNEVLAQVCAEAPIIHRLRSEIGRNPIYRMTFNDLPIAVFHPGVGAPLAASFLEESVALGCRKFIVVGGAGVLHREITVGHAVIPTHAIRDEGVSYHYLPASREVEASPEAVQAIRAALEHHHIPYVLGKTWTTDAIYRETRARMKRRSDEGCLTVEMEAASLFAIAQFRGVTLGQLLYGGDDLTGDEWDDRNWDGLHSTREKLFWLALEAASAL